jgi:hypothetical protein
MTVWVAGAIVGSAAIGAFGATSAADTQAGGQQQAAQTQQNMFNTINAQEQPFIQSGYGANATLAQLLGIGSPSTGGTTPGTNTVAPPTIAQFTTSVPNNNVGALPGGGSNEFGLTNFGGQTTPPITTFDQAGYDKALAAYNASRTAPAATPGPTSGSVGSTGLPAGFLTQPFNPTQTQLNNYPGYQFALQTGGQAIRNADTPGVGALSGPALKDLMNFNVGTANQFYGQYFNQDLAQKNAIFGRLSAIAGLGQNAASNVGTAGTSLGTGVAQAQAGAAASQAGGIVGATNAIGSSGVPLAYLLAGQNSGGGNSALLNQGGGGSTSGTFGGS